MKQIDEPFDIDDNENPLGVDPAGADPGASPKHPRTWDNLDRKLKSMIRELRWAGRSLPAVTGAAPTGMEDDETLLADIDLLVVAAWLRHSPCDDLGREPFRAIVLRGARELGVKPWTKVAPTLDDLRAAAPSPCATAIGTPAPSAKVRKVKTAQTALALLQQVFVLPGSIRLDAVFGDEGGYAQKRAALLLSETDPKKPARLAAELDRLNAAAVALIGANALPDEFSACLRVLIMRSGLSVEDVAKRSGSYVNRLRNLLRGSQPRLDMAPFIRHLEEVLGAKPGTLWRLVKSPRLRIPTDAVYTDAQQTLFKAANVPAEILPANGPDLSDAEKENAIDWVVDHIILASPYRRLQRIEERLQPRLLQRIQNHNAHTGLPNQEAAGNHLQRNPKTPVNPSSWPWRPSAAYCAVQSRGLHVFQRSVVDVFAVVSTSRLPAGKRARRAGGRRLAGESAVADATEPMRRRTTKRAAGSKREERADGAVSAKRNVTDSLTAALGCEIIAGLYPPGSRLPNEASLLVRFGVSRPTLREAFRALEAKGLIVSRQKVGTMVRPKVDWHMLDADFLAWHMQAAPTEVFVSDVLQLRRIFEPQAAALAAEARDAASLARIEAAYADIEAHKSGDAELIAADVRFHKEILQATGNRLLGALGSLIEMALVGTFKMAWRSLAIKDDRLHQHRDVMQAIAARRPEAARAAMAKLLQESAII